MSKNLVTQRVSCQCGKVQLEVSGSPILTSVCHCDDCQKGSRQLEALPGAPKILEAAGGSPYVLYRRDRVKVAAGAELMKEQRLEGESFTRRVYASCCNSAMFLDFEKGHWLTLYRGRFVGAVIPVQMHLQTKYAPSGTKIPDDAPAFTGFPGRFIAKLLGSRVAMMFGR